MAVASIELRRGTTPDRRPATATVSFTRSFAFGAPPSAAQALQQRFGNLGTEALLRASVEPAPAAFAPGPAAPATDTADAATTDVTAQPAVPAEAAPGEVAVPPPEAGEATPGAEMMPGAEAAPEAAVDPQAQLAPLTAEIAGRAETQAAHPPAKRGIDSAEAAATEPKTESRRFAAHAVSKRVAVASKQAAEKPAGVIEAEKFKKALHDKLAALMPPPKSAEDAQKALQSGTAQTVSGEMRGELQQQKSQAVGAVPQAVSTEPQPGEFPQPEAPPLRVEQPGARPAPIDPAGAVPPPVPDARLNTDEHRAPADAELQQGRVSADNLAASPDPSVAEVGHEYKDAKAESESAPAEIRADEAQIHNNAEARAAVGLAQGLAGMAKGRGGRFAAVAGHQQDTKADHEKERQDITAKLESIQKEARADVEKILNEMEETATKMFEAGLKRALDAFEAERAKLEDEMRRKRQAEWSKYLGGWLADLSYYFDLDEESVDRTVEGARKAYQAEVDKAIDEVATYVGEKLAAAKARAAKGEADADDFVAKLKPGLQEIGRQARAQVQGEFDKLRNDIDGRRDALIDKMGKSYAESLKEVEARIEAFRDANKSWWQRIKEKIKAIIKIILEFKDLLFSILAKVAGIIDAILSDPIGFLGNLVDGVKLGLSNFIDHIVEHLKAGLLTWMFGALAATGIHMPTSFGPKEILGLVLEVLGLTYENIRARAVAIVGEPIVARLEQAAEIFKVLITEGPAGLWNFLMEKLDALKEQALGQIREMVITQVIKAGIMWVIGLLNPASAFLKACKAIYDIVMFFIERGRELVDLINAILDSLAAVVGGNLARMASAVEKALAKAIPVVIGFLASLLGLGGISEKIQEIIQKIQAPVNKAIDWLIGKAVAGVQKASGAIKGVFARKEDHPDDPQKQAKIEAGVQALVDRTNTASTEGKIEKKAAKKIAADVKKDHPVFKSIKVIDGDDSWDYEYRASRNKVEGGRKGIDVNTIARAKVRAYEILLELLSGDVDKAAAELKKGKRLVGSEEGEPLTAQGMAVSQVLEKDLKAKKKSLKPGTWITVELPTGTYKVQYKGKTNIYVPVIGSYQDIEREIKRRLKQLKSYDLTIDQFMDMVDRPREAYMARDIFEHESPGLGKFLDRFKILREIVEVVRSPTQVTNIALAAEPSTAAEVGTGQPMSISGAQAAASRREAIAGVPNELRGESKKPPKKGTKAEKDLSKFDKKTLDQVEKELKANPKLAGERDDEDALTTYFVKKVKEYHGITES